MRLDGINTFGGCDNCNLDYRVDREGNQKEEQ
jgi:hypothetical protein